MLLLRSICIPNLVYAEPSNCVWPQIVVGKWTQTIVSNTARGISKHIKCGCKKGCNA